VAKLEIVKIDRLQESKTNPRQFFDKKSMGELVASIHEKGIITPLLVRQGKGGLGEMLEIIAGSRRYRAAKDLGLKEIPVVIRDLTDAEALELQVIENDQRTDVHPLEQCAGYQRLMKDNKLTVEQLAKCVGKSLSYIQRRLLLANLIEPIHKLFVENKIAMGHALLASRLTVDQQKQSVAWLKREDSVGGYAEEIERHFFLVLKNALFNTADEKLVPKAGSCVNCPKRTGFNKALFEDVKGDDTCTDPTCFQEKTTAFVKIQVGTHKDAVLLSLGDYSYSSEKPKGLTDWTTTGGKNCPDTKQGVLVQKQYENDVRGKLGQILTVCTNLKCKTHRNGAGSSSPRTSDPHHEAMLRAERKRRVELKRRGLVFSLIASAPLSPTETDYRAILDWGIHNLSHDSARALGQAMKWEAPVKYNSRDWCGCVKRELQKVKGKDVHKWLLLVALADTELWNHAGGSSDSNVKPKLLEATAKRKGVNLAKIAKLAAAKPARKTATPKKPGKAAKKGGKS
jgi:ParB/RepB/Spo0J family partition protein